MPHMMKSVRISESLYHAADKEAEVMHRSTAGQLEYWASLGRKAELLLDAATLQALLQVSLVENAQASSQKNNQKMAELMSHGLLSSDSLRFFNQALVKDSVAEFSGADF
ncbi:Protein of unknown function (DUF3423) [Methylophilaceae bacterium 11]|nr:Protein of unknown function (DUF3423) [Methylophilaceae bacterium 11]